MVSCAFQRYSPMSGSRQIEMAGRCGAVFLTVHDARRSMYDCFFGVPSSMWERSFCDSALLQIQKVCETRDQTEVPDHPVGRSYSKPPCDPPHTPCLIPLSDQNYLI